MELPQSAEFQLAAACAIWPPSDLRTAAIRSAANQPINWIQFLRVIRRHRVFGLVHDGLMRAALQVPMKIAHEINEEAKRLVRENLAMAGEALRLKGLFDDADLMAVFLKGSSLAMLAYGNLGLRSGKDIDLLVSPETLPLATALIERAGYCRFDPPQEIGDAQLQLLMRLRKDLGFLQTETGMQIELHWRLFLNPYAMNESTAMTAARIVPLTETAGLGTLGEEDLFAYLCVHGALHSWNQLKWLADIGALLGAAPDGDAERLYHAADARGAGCAAAQAILLCERLLITPLTASLRSKLRKRFKLGWLENTALIAMTAGRGQLEPRDLRFGTTRGSLSAFLLGRGWRYYLAEFRNLLMNQTDVLELPLPAPIRFLYPILRLPLWIWRHASRSPTK